jgi:two-component system OmpR family sensor kinase
MVIAPSSSQARPETEGLPFAIAVASHELRAPLLATRAALERLLYAPASDSERRSLLEQGADELDRLASLTQVLLEWAGGTVPLAPERIDLVSVVLGAIEEVRREQPGRSISLLAPSRLRLTADPVHVRIAISNLLRNALAYSPVNEEVEVVVLRSSRSAVVQVRDHGPGLDADHPEIFDPLVRGRVGRARGTGAGLGLFIAHQIVEAHGGTISAESDENGTAFRIFLRHGSWPL